MKEIVLRVYVKELNRVCRVLQIDFLNHEVCIVFDEARATQHCYNFKDVEFSSVNIQ